VVPVNDSLDRGSPAILARNSAFQPNRSASSGVKLCQV
jgi:hypothetical protein